MRRAICGTLLFAVVHAVASLWLIPRTNIAFQHWFDTGSPMSKSESIGYLVALILSFPVAVRTLALHPARVGTQELVISVVANSSLWAACLYFALMWLRRKRHL